MPRTSPTEHWLLQMLRAVPGTFSLGRSQCRYVRSLAAIFVHKILRGENPGDLPVPADQIRTGAQSKGGCFARAGKIGDMDGSSRIDFHSRANLCASTICGGNWATTRNIIGVCSATRYTFG